MERGPAPSGQDVAVGDEPVEKAPVGVSHASAGMVQGPEAQAVAMKKAEKGSKGPVLPAAESPPEAAMPGSPIRPRPVSEGEKAAPAASEGQGPSARDPVYVVLEGS